MEKLLEFKKLTWFTKEGNVINPNSLPHYQSLSLENGTFPNPSTPSNSLIKFYLDVPIANRKGVRTYTKSPSLLCLLPLSKP